MQNPKFCSKCVQASYKPIQKSSKRIELIQSIHPLVLYSSSTEHTLDLSPNQKDSQQMMQKFEIRKQEKRSENEKHSWLLSKKLSIRQFKGRLFKEIGDYILNYQNKSQNNINYENQLITDNSQIQQYNQIITIVNTLLQSAKYYSYTIIQYRVLAYKLDEQSVQQMKEEDLLIHQQIFGPLFSNKQYEDINKIKNETMKLITDFLSIIKNVIVTPNSSQDKYKSNNNFNKIKIKGVNSTGDTIDQMETEDLNISTYVENKQLNLQNSQILKQNNNYTCRITSALARMQKGIYVTRF